MSPDEKLLYDSYACSDGVPKWADVNRVTDATLEDLNTGLGKRRAALASYYGHVGPWQLQQQAARDAYGRLARDTGDGPADRAARWARLTKFQALKRDLEALAAASPNASVVIFTHHNVVLSDVAKMLRAMDWTARRRRARRPCPPPRTPPRRASAMPRPRPHRAAPSPLRRRSSRSRARARPAHATRRCASSSRARAPRAAPPSSPPSPPRRSG